MQLRGLLCAAIVLFSAPAAAERPPPSSYEGRALDRALDHLGLEIDPAPEGKVLDRIWVVNLDVFSPDDDFLQVFNVFHRTTRWRAIEREVILRPGEVWDEQEIALTERKLRNPIFTSLVVISAIKSARPGRVDLLVATRDVWSLRFNSNFEVQQCKLTDLTQCKFIDLTLSISENNFLGLRKQIALVFDMDQGSFFLGPLYRDTNVLGKRWQLVTRAGPLFGRESGLLEGSLSSTTLSRPFWSFDTEWGGALSLSHFDGTVRLFRGTDVRTYDAPETDEVEEVPWIYDQRNITLGGSVSRSFGRDVVQRVSLGYQLDSTRPTLPDDFAQPDAVRDAFVRDVFPRSERTSSVYTVYQVFTPRFVAYRDISTYDLKEDATLGPDVSATFGAAARVLGSENNFVFGSLSGGYRHDLRRDGFLRTGATLTTRLDGGDLIDNRVDAVAEAILPRVKNLFRVGAQAQLSMRVREAQNRFLSVGGSSGLRGYSINEFIGQRRVLFNAEIRTMSTRIWFARLGAVAFYDAGHAADRLADLRLHHDVGVGIRWLMPQLAPLVYRFDWAIPLNGTNAGLPGRFIISTGQVF